MGIAYKIALCPNERDTKKLIELLETIDNPLVSVEGLMIAKRNINLHYKDVLGMEILDNKKIPFYHTGEHQQNNMDLYYVDSPYGKIDATEKELEEAIIKARPWFGEEKELFINKNSTIICLVGERASLQNGLTLFKIDRMAEDEIASLSDNLENLKDFLTEGKIDMKKAMPYFMNKISKEILNEDVIKLLNSVIVIDLDGVADANNYFPNSGHFKLRSIKRV